MSNRQVSSLDRFVHARGPVLMGIFDDARRLKVLSAVAGVYGTVGMVSLVGVMAFGSADALGAAIPAAFLLAASGVLAGVCAGMKRRLRPHQVSDAKLTPEARELLRSLLTHLEGWPFGRRRRRLRYRRAMRRGLLRSLHDRRCEDVLAPRVFQLLDAAAAEYNRIYGALALDDPVRNATLERLAPNIRAAGDEGMAELLHLAALLDRFPESGSSWEAQAQGQVQELKELADQVARLQPSIEPAPVLGEGSSRIQSVLEELRADQRAREELRLSTATDEVQQLHRAS